MRWLSRGWRRVDGSVVEKLVDERKVDHAEIACQVGLKMRKSLPPRMLLCSGNATYLEGKLVSQDTSNQVGDITCPSVSFLDLSPSHELPSTINRSNHLTVHNRSGSGLGRPPASRADRDRGKRRRKQVDLPNSQFMRKGSAKPSHDLNVAFLIT